MAATDAQRGCSTQHSSAGLPAASATTACTSAAAAATAVVIARQPPPLPPPPLPSPPLLLQLLTCGVHENQGPAPGITPGQGCREGDELVSPMPFSAHRPFYRARLNKGGNGKSNQQPARPSHPFPPHLTPSLIPPHTCRLVPPSTHILPVLHSLPSTCFMPGMPGPYGNHLPPTLPARVGRSVVDGAWPSGTRLATCPL